MNIEQTAIVRLDSAEAAPGIAVATADLGVPAPAATVEAPESSTLVLLIIASALWLLRLRRRFNRRSRRF